MRHLSGSASISAMKYVRALMPAAVLYRGWDDGNQAWGGSSG